MFNRVEYYGTQYLTTSVYEVEYNGKNYICEVEPKEERIEIYRVANCIEAIEWGNVNPKDIKVIKKSTKICRRDYSL